MTAVSVRIPRAANTALDAVERHPWVSATSAVTAVAGVFALLRPSLAAAMVFAYLTFVMGATWQQGVIRDLRARNGALEADNAAKDARLLRVEAGEASAATMEIRSIRDRGELS